MKKIFEAMILLLLVGFAGGFVGAVAIHMVFNFDRQITESQQPPSIVVSLDSELDAYVPLWQREIHRRFDNAVGIIGHGLTLTNGQWVIAKSRQLRPVEDVIAEYRKLYPQRIIVLISCNPEHAILRDKNVYYAMSNVWVVPDRELNSSITESEARKMVGKTRWEREPDVVGNIFEFVHG